MKIKEIFKNEEEVINYISENKITNDNAFTISDVIRIVRNNPEKTYLLAKYISFRKDNLITQNNKKNNDDLFINANNEVIKHEGKVQSAWENIATKKEGKYTYDRILKSYLKKLAENENIEKDVYNVIISIFDLQKDIYKDLIFLDTLGKVNFVKIIDYNDFIKMINHYNNYLYLNLWISDNYLKYLKRYNVKRVGDLKKHLNASIYDKEYSELYGLLPLLKETNKPNIPSDYIIEKYINSKVKQNDNIIFMLKVKNTKNKIITKILDATYKKIKKGYEEVLKAFQNFFDSFAGRYIIKYILSIKSGFFTENDLKKLLPKYYIVIEYLIKRNHIFGVKYNEVYDVYTYKDIPSDEHIFKKYYKYINHQQYQKLIEELKTNIYAKIDIDENIIIKRVNKEYEKYDLFFARGYVSTEYKICFLYNKEFSRGFKDMIEFERKYYSIYKENIKIDNIIYVYFFRINNIYLLKSQYQKKYFNLSVTYQKEYASIEEISLVYMICESYRVTFTLENIVNNLKSHICESKIKNILKNSLLYYQLKSCTYIKSDCLKITDEMKKYFFLVSKMTKKEMYSRVKERYNDFLKYYKIKNAKYLFQIVKKITQKDRK